MTSTEIISLIVSIIGILCLCLVFTILYGNYTYSYIDEVESGKRDIDLIDDLIYENLSKVKKRRRIIEIIKSIIFYVIVICVCIPLLSFALYNKINGTTPMINQQGIMVVASGSMSQRHENNEYLDIYNLYNQFNTYDIIVVEAINDESELEKYDVIAFKNDKGINVIHRIIDIKVVNGQTVYVTRGDSNKSSDTYNPVFEDIIGVYNNKRVKTIGIFVMFFQSYQGMFTILAVIYAVMMVGYYNKKSEEVEDFRLDKLQNSIEYEDGAENVDDFYCEFNETIYYKDTAYYFNESGFVKKEKLSKEEYERIKKIKEDES